MNLRLIPEDELTTKATRLREKLETGKGTLEDAKRLDECRTILARIREVRTSHATEDD